MYKEGVIYIVVNNLILKFSSSGELLKKLPLPLESLSYDRKTFGCPSGGTGLGFSDRYGSFPIDCLLSKGIKEMASQTGRAGDDMAKGERFYKNPELARKGLIRCRSLMSQRSMSCLSLGKRLRNRTNRS
jgi:hypothetical protein